jgi:hypothetical protein
VVGLFLLPRQAQDGFVLSESGRSGTHCTEQKDQYEVQWRHDHCLGAHFWITRACFRREIWLALRLIKRENAAQGFGSATVLYCLAAVRRDETTKRKTKNERHWPDSRVAKWIFKIDLQNCNRFAQTSSGLRWQTGAWLVCLGTGRRRPTCFSITAMQVRKRSF